jgi:streptogramin lyase
MRRTIGPDGSAWFSEIPGNKIGRIEADGEVTEYFAADMAPVVWPAERQRDACH